MSDPVTPIADRGVKGEVRTAELDRHERTLARRSAESRATVPTVDYATTVELGADVASEAESGSGIGASVVSAVAHALRAHPRVNGSYRDGRYELYSRVNVGVVLIGDGLDVAPTIFDADTKTPADIAAELAHLRARAQVSELHPSELTGATFTVVDFGEYDAMAVSPLILPPQAGALAFGPIRERPVLRDGQVVAGVTMQLALAVDHRIVYGHHAAAFLGEVKAFLEEART